MNGQNTHSNSLLDSAGIEAVEAAVKEAERHTSAEIKVVILRHCWRDIRDKAAQLFLEQGLDKTAQRNAVMILVVTANREFLIYGDLGIHKQVGQGFWDEVRDKMRASFSEKRYAEGITEGVTLIGKKLVEFFPVQEDDKDEISNDVTVLH